MNGDIRTGRAGRKSRSPEPVPQYRARMQRSGDAHHRAIHKDIRTNIQRGIDGRFVWNPVAQRVLDANPVLTAE